MCGGYKKGANPSAYGKNKIQWITDLPAGLRGRVILGKGNDMEELIKRLERVIQTGAPDKDGMHPISAETVLEVAKGLSEHGTNLAEVGTDLISRQAAIDALCNDYCGGHQDCKYYPNCENLRSVQKLPSAQPERARGTWMPDTMCYYEERFICSECKGNYKVDTRMGKPMWNFCPNCGAKMEVNT